jgi:hypothetical protein
VRRCREGSGFERSYGGVESEPFRRGEGHPRGDEVRRQDGSSPSSPSRPNEGERHELHHDPREVQGERREKDRVDQKRGGVTWRGSVSPLVIGGGDTLARSPYGGAPRPPPWCPSPRRGSQPSRAGPSIPGPGTGPLTPEPRAAGFASRSSFGRRSGSALAPRGAARAAHTSAPCRVTLWIECPFWEVPPAGKAPLIPTVVYPIAL